MEEENKTVEQPVAEPSAPSYAPAPQPPKKNNLLLIIIALVLLVAIGVGAYYIGEKVSEGNEEKETSKKSKKDKEKDKDDEDDDEDDDDTGKGSKKEEEDKPTGTKTISCSGDFEGMQGATMNIEFTYSNSKKTITSGSMDMKMDMKAMLKEMGGAELTDEQLEAALSELEKADANEICESMKDDERYKNCSAKINGSVITAHTDFDVNALMGDLSDGEEQFDPADLADALEGELGVSCSVR